MSMQCTQTWLVRCRVRGRVSYFSTTDNHKMTSSPHVTMKNVHRNLKSEKLSKTRQLNSPMVKEKNKDVIQVVNKYDDSNWSLSVEEDYIVFCFGEDASLDVVKDGKSAKSSKKHRPRNTKNPKLSYAEDKELQEVNEQQIHENRSNDEEVKEMEIEQHRESDQSEGSNGSFAFPVLNWECMGSPAKMPKPEDGLCQKKHRFVPFQCFRF